MTRSLIHPGAPAAERWRSVVASGRWTELVLRKGLSINAAVAHAFANAGFDGGYVRLNGAILASLRYVIPAASDGAHAAWYSQAFAFEGTARIEEAGAVAGWRDGERFLHCHGIWILADGSRRMGHLLPHDSFLAEDAAVEALGVSGASFYAEEDDETAFKLFAPKGVADTSSEGCRIVVCTVRPNEDICHAIEAICRGHGISGAKLHGIGSLLGADFQDGSHVSSYATEVLIRQGAATSSGDGPRCRLDIALVGMDGAIAEGVLAHGQNPVCVTFELLLEVLQDGP